MNKYSTEFYHNAIKSVHPDAHSIRSPEYPGRVATVFFAQTELGPMVYRFNSSRLVIRNSAVGTMLASYGIPVPVSKPHSYKDVWFEEYPYRAGKTLGEAIATNSISEKQMQMLFRNVMHLQYKMSLISPANIKNVFAPYFYQIRNHIYRNMGMNPLLANALTTLVRMESYDPQRIYHNDLTPGNILISPDGKGVEMLLDMDSVAISGDTFAMGAFMNAMSKYCDTSDALHFFCRISGYDINTTQIDILNAMRRIKHFLER